MNILGYIDLYDPDTLLDDQGSSLSLPPITLGDRLAVGMRFFDRVGGSKVLTDLDIRSLSASLVKIGAVPTRGTFRARIGANNPPVTTANTTAALAFNVTAATFAASLTALDAGAPYGVCTGEDAGSCTWVLTFAGNTGPVPLTFVSLTLAPTSFVQVRAYQDDGGIWRHEVKLILAPIAAVGLAARIMPPSPEISRVTAGNSEAGVEVNEVQALSMPPQFRGTYNFTRVFKETGLLDISDFAEEIQAALEAAYGAGNFAVTNPTDDVFHIEFIGDFAAQAQDLLVVTVKSAPPGDWTIKLPVDRAPAYAALRGQAEDEFTLEIRAFVADEGQGSLEPGYPRVLLRVPVTVRRIGKPADNEVVGNIDWLTPAEPSTFVPSNPSNVITGQQHYVAAFGDGAAASFVVMHNLGTLNLSGVEVRENVDGGRLLDRPADYTITAITANSVTLTFAFVPAAAALVATITSAGPTSAFIEGLQIEIGQVNGLQTILNGLGDDVAALQAVYSTAGAGSAAAGTALAIAIPDAISIFPRDFDKRVKAILADLKIEGSGDEAKAPLVDQSLLSRPPALLSAVDDVATETWTDNDPVSGITGGFVNRVFAVAAADQDLPMGDGYRATVVREGSFFGSNGREMWYPLRFLEATRTYYPLSLERTLFPVVPVNAAQFRVGATFEMTFSVALQLLAANTTAEYSLVIELGAFTGHAATSPASGPNLSKIAWNVVPALTQRLDVTNLQIAHRFGLRVQNKSTGITADTLAYNTWLAAAAVPASAAFAVRARLVNFDVAEEAGSTEVDDSIADPRGYVFSALFNAAAKITL